MKNFRNRRLFLSGSRKSAACSSESRGFQIVILIIVGIIAVNSLVVPCYHRALTRDDPMIGQYREQTGVDQEQAIGEMSDLWGINCSDKVLQRCTQMELTYLQGSCSTLSCSHISFARIRCSLPPCPSSHRSGCERGSLRRWRR